MSTRVEFESFNPLSEFFEQEEEFFEQEEDEVRRRNRSRRIAPRVRNRFNFANRNARVLQPWVFPGRFIRPFPRPRPSFPFPQPFPIPPVETSRPNQGAGAMPDGAEPVSDGWDPQGAPVEATDQRSPEGNGQTGMDQGDGDAAQATDVQQTSGDEEFFEFFPEAEFGENEFGLSSEYENWEQQLSGGTRTSGKCKCHQEQAESGEFEFGVNEREASGAGRKQRPTINLGEVVICGGKPTASLDNFSFGKWTLRKDSTRNHPAQIDTIAREIVNRATRRRPVPTVCIVGHTDDVGTRDFNYGLGLQRAKSVKEALCKRLGRYANTMTFVVNSMGEMDPSPRGTSPTARARNRRVDVHLLSERLDGERCAPVGGGQVPDDRCGVPITSARRELEIAQELEEFENTPPARRVQVQPKLSLFLDASVKSERNHFHHQAQGTARRIRAIASPNASDCNLRVGPTPYATGADIIKAIRAAWQCTGKQPIQTVHIFGHSGHQGISGNTLGRAGLYQNSMTIDHAAGGRHISEIPTNVLSNNVIFVLHGCRQAEGCNVKGDDDNFAQSLFQHLSAKLSNPRVYGHYNRGCAGRDNSWCMYSKTVPKGRAHSRPNYTDPGGCRTSRP